MATVAQWRRVLLGASKLRAYGEAGNARADEIMEKAGGRIMADAELTTVERDELLVDALVVAGSSF